MAEKRRKQIELLHPPQDQAQNSDIRTDFPKFQIKNIYSKKVEGKEKQRQIQQYFNEMKESLRKDSQIVSLPVEIAEHGEERWNY